MFDTSCNDFWKGKGIDSLLVIKKQTYKKRLANDTRNQTPFSKVHSNLVSMKSWIYFLRKWSQQFHKFQEFETLYVQTSSTLVVICLIFVNAFIWKKGFCYDPIIVIIKYNNTSNSLRRYRISGMSSIIFVRKYVKLI